MEVKTNIDRSVKNVTSLLQEMNLDTNEVFVDIICVTRLHKKLFFLLHKLIRH